VAAFTIVPVLEAAKWVLRRRPQAALSDRADARLN
jgi:hypothetical protein